MNVLLLQLFKGGGGGGSKRSVTLSPKGGKKSEMRMSEASSLNLQVLSKSEVTVAKNGAREVIEFVIFGGFSKS